MKKTLKNITIISAGVSLILSCTNCSNTTSTDQSSPKEISSTVDTVGEKLDSIYSSWTEVSFQEDGIIESMAYADTSNFVGQKIYPCARCFLRPEAAKALMIAKGIATQKGLKLIVFDCYRPTQHQQEMFDLVQDSKYVAEPKEGGSMHNKGLAVDIALTDSLGNILDFGGAFDEFSEVSHHGYDKLNSLAISNRVLLKKIMSEAGFTPYPYEWWHYSYKQVDYNLDDFIWTCN